MVRCSKTRWWWLWTALMLPAQTADVAIYGVLLFSERSECTACCFLPERVLDLSEVRPMFFLGDGITIPASVDSNNLSECGAANPGHLGLMDPIWTAFLRQYTSWSLYSSIALPLYTPALQLHRLDFQGSDESRFCRFHGVQCLNETRLETLCNVTNFCTADKFLHC